MYWNDINYIPTGRSQKAEKLRKVILDSIFNAKNTVAKILWDLHKTCPNKEKITWNRKFEWTIFRIRERKHTKLYELTSSSLGQLTWYLPIIPQYLFLNWKKDISIGLKIIQENEKRESEFVWENITIAISPISVQAYEAANGILGDLSPSILESTIIYKRYFDMITWHINIPDCSDPKITAQVGYLVYLLKNLSNNTRALTGIYIYQNPAILKELIEFLANLKVSNMENLDHSIQYLRELYFAINTK